MYCMVWDGIVWYCIVFVLYCIVLYLYCIVLYCVVFVLHCIVLYGICICIVLYCTVCMYHNHNMSSYSRRYIYSNSWYLSTHLNHQYPRGLRASLPMKIRQKGAQQAIQRCLVEADSLVVHPHLSWRNPNLLFWYIFIQQ